MKFVFLELSWIMTGSEEKAASKDMTNDFRISEILPPEDHNYQIIKIFK